jgi:hypothetical protein
MVFNRNTICSIYTIFLSSPHRGRQIFRIENLRLSGNPVIFAVFRKKINKISKDRRFEVSCTYIVCQIKTVNTTCTVLPKFCLCHFICLAVSLCTTGFNIQKCYMVLALRWVFYTYLKTDSDFCFVHHKLIGFYNLGGVFTARYGLIYYINQITCSILKGYYWVT